MEKQKTKEIPQGSSGINNILGFFGLSKNITNERSIFNKIFQKEHEPGKKEISEGEEIVILLKQGTMKSISQAIEKRANLPLNIDLRSNVEGYDKAVAFAYFTTLNELKGKIALKIFETFDQGIISSAIKEPSLLNYTDTVESVEGKVTYA